MAKKTVADAAKKLKITLIKSTISCTEKQKATVVALGLKKIGAETVQSDSATLQGQLKVVGHLVAVSEVQE